ncbi:MAG: SprT-like domain-containing protein [Pseudobutyrivibrio sp.]|nr:SprT-like domain-containing protein [Pseudobutyrivibrio sp.]
MKDFNRLITESMNEVTHLGIKPGNITSWTINKRAKTRWGLCKQNPDKTFEIQIAEALLVDDRISEKSCKETIIHEILHTCKNCMKHTGQWKYYAEVINQVYGYNIKRVTTGIEKGVEDYKSNSSMAIKYIFTCGNCGATIYRKRDSQFTKNYRHYGCGRCGAVAWQKKMA